jgi:hypothetical protein
MRGRPTVSQIRQNIVEILYFMENSYGYDIYKIYRELFPKITLRSVYYHLKKGTAIGEFKIEKVKAEKGNYSWGNEVEKTYYALGPNAKPSCLKKVQEYLKKSTTS